MASPNAASAAVPLLKSLAAFAAFVAENGAAVVVLSKKANLIEAGAVKNGVVLARVLGFAGGK